MDPALQSIFIAGSPNALIVMSAKDLSDFADSLIRRTQKIVEEQCNPQYYDVEELAELLHVTKTTVYNLAHDGRLRPLKVGRKTVFNRAHVQDAIKAGLLGRYVHK